LDSARRRKTGGLFFVLSHIRAGRLSPTCLAIHFYSEFSAQRRRDSFFRHPQQESIMSRKYIDCREFPSDMQCSVAIAADTDDELLEAAVQHAVAVHHHPDSPELRQQIKQSFKEGTPPAQSPVSV
jgi:predicted small metal-binding protein